MDGWIDEWMVGKKKIIKKALSLIKTCGYYGLCVVDAWMDRRMLGGELGDGCRIKGLVGG